MGHNRDGATGGDMRSWRRWLRRAVCLACIPLVLAACSEGDGDVDSAITGESRLLATPTPRSDVSLEETLEARRSVRDFTSVPLTGAEISRLLWAAQGTTGGGRGRTGVQPLRRSQ